MEDMVRRNMEMFERAFSMFLPFAQNTYPDLSFDFIMKPPFVKGKPNVFSHTDTWNLVVPKYVKGAEKDATFKFLKFLISEEGQLLFLDANPGLSPLKSLVFNNDYYKTGKGKYLAPVIAAIKAGAYRFWGPFIDADTMLYNVMWPNMDALIHQQVTVDQCERAMLELPGGVGLGMDIGDLFQLESTFQCNGIVDPAAQEQRVLLGREALGPASDGRLQLQHSLEGRRQMPQGLQV
jgi:hypothetical protein